ncbi:hypothetical protein [Paraburkholderia bryophila]|uniref:Uncharacterized protein n=1 Tax=Paraburkholderia bryophila TaxID=420952 RepID=A0A7Y9WT79_9BURK|nr:hypothetical protein [Paraburkholderia bryophila]NYH26068.1 hypothetical protein [Paraburkholderia bryophila]
MTHKPILACEVGRHQHWTTSDNHVFKTFNTWSGCEEDDINVRDLPQFKRWERIVEAFLQALHDEKIVLVNMDRVQVVDEMTIRRRLVTKFLKEHVEERAKRHQALDLLTTNGLSFDEAYSMLRPIY